jgi:hypothetical protein
MQMEMEVKDELGVALERLSAAAGLLEQVAERFAGVELQAARVSPRESQLEQRLAEAEATIASLRAENGRGNDGRIGARKTLPVGAGQLVSRDGVTLQAGALDQALRSLSLEQRIAVKSEMARAGLLS